MFFCAAERFAHVGCGSAGADAEDHVWATGVERDENYDLLVELCDTMEDASLCAMGGMTPFPVRSVLKFFAEDFASAQEADH